jgi:integrase
MQPQQVTSTSSKEGAIAPVPRKSSNVASLQTLSHTSHTVRTLKSPLPSGTISLKEEKLGRKKVEKRSRGQIEQRGERKWLVRVYVGTVTDDKGKKKRSYSSKIVLGTFKQAERTMTGMLNEVDKDEFIPPTNQTLKQFMDAWFEHTAKMRVSATTLTSYRSSTKRPLAAIGHVRLDELTPQVFQAVYTKLAADGISPRTIEMGNTVLRMALEKAVVWQLIVRNPTRGAERPAKAKSDVAQAFTAEEVDLFLEAAKSNGLHALWLAFVTTGLRPQEMFALKWTDIEERIARVQRNGGYISAATTVLNVQRAMKQVGGGRYEVSTVMKTKKSKRTVAIPATLVEALTAHKKAQAEMMLSAGESFERNGYIFTNRYGRPLDVNNVRDNFHALCKKAKIRAIRLYDLRHTHATLLLGAGVHLKIVSERLGHSSIMLTGDTYSHVMPEVEHETALTVEAMLRKQA